MTALPVSSYAPGASTHVSEVTVAAVDKIGNATSDQIRHTADQIEAEAKEIGDKLRQLADAFDEQTRLASEKVSDFCLRMAAARDMARGLEGQISDRAVAAKDDGEPSPEFLHTTDAAGRPNGHD